MFRKVHTNICKNFHLLHQSVRHAPVNLQPTLGTLTEMLRKYHAHKSATQEGVKYVEMVELNDHFWLGMFNLSKEKNILFGIDGGNEEDMEDNTLISAELELEVMGYI